MKSQLFLMRRSQVFNAGDVTAERRDGDSISLLLEHAHARLRSEHQTPGLELNGASIKIWVSEFGGSYRKIELVDWRIYGRLTFVKKMMEKIIAELASH